MSNNRTSGRTSPAAPSPHVGPVPGVLEEPTLWELLDVELARARRYEHPFAILRVRTADAAGLRRAAGALRLHTRWADSVGLCGDALLVILRDTPPAGAQSALENIRTSLASEPGAGQLSFEIAAWRKGDDRPRLLERLR